jgi:hypothetical protein
MTSSLATVSWEQELQVNEFVAPWNVYQKDHDPAWGLGSSKKVKL